MHFHKAFNKFDTVLEALQEYRVDYRYTKLIYTIYKNATIMANLRENTKSLPTRREVNKGIRCTPKCLLQFEGRGLDEQSLTDNLKDMKLKLQELQEA